MTRRWFNHFSKIALLLLINFAYSNLYVTGGVGAKSFTDNLQYTLNVLRDINGGETVFESRLGLGYMSSNLKRFNYFAELGLSYLPQDMAYFGKYPNGSEVNSAVTELSSDAYAFGRIGTMFCLIDQTYVYVHGAIEHGFDETFSFTPYSRFGDPIDIESTAYGGGVGVRVMLNKRLFYDTSYTYVFGGSFDAYAENYGDPLKVTNSPRRSTFIASIGGMF